ncbi:MAG: DUF4405 domain-containing protein [Geobacteraceae bacterium]|nr:DUF4405 domain-containing protein [Geobacteraceae bacterium]
MRREKINFMIDTVAFAAFVLLTSTGVIMSYILPPGSGRFSVLWGMDRHDWGRLHFWVAVVLMTTLGLHLVFHWRWIAGMIKGRPREGSGIRMGLAVVGVLALLGLAALPFMGRVEQTGAEPPHRMRLTDHEKVDKYDIDGSMTLSDVEKRTGVPPEVLLRELGLPPGLPTDENLGRLRKKYGFELNDVREVVRKQVGRK